MLQPHESGPQIIVEDIGAGLIGYGQQFIVDVCPAPVMGDLVNFLFKEAMVEAPLEFFTFILSSVAMYSAFMLCCYMISSITSMIGKSKGIGIIIGIGLFFANIILLAFVTGVADGITDGGADHEV